MATQRQVQRAAQAADNRTKEKKKAAKRFAKGLTPSRTTREVSDGGDEGDYESECTPSEAGRVLGRLARMGGVRKSKAPRRRAASKPTSTAKPSTARPGAKRKAATPNPPRSGLTSEKGLGQPGDEAAANDSGVPSPTGGETVLVAIDVALEDLRASAKASGKRVDRRAVAKALRQMLHQRHRGFTVRGIRGRAAALEVVPGAGSSTFGPQHHGALRDLFGGSDARRSSVKVLLARDGSRGVTSITASIVDEFRARVAAAAGLEKPGPFAAVVPAPEVEGAKRRRSEEVAANGPPTRPASAPAKRVRGKAKPKSTAHDPLGLEALVGSTPLHALALGLGLDDVVEIHAKALRHSPETVSVTEPVVFGSTTPPYVATMRTSSGRSGDEQRGPGVLMVEGSHVTFSPTLTLSPVEVDRIVVVSRAPRTEDPLRMDVILRDLEPEVERKHVAVAVRKLLRHLTEGISVRTPNHSMASTLDLSPKGDGRFTEEQNAALRRLFGEDSRGGGQFTVLVTPFIGDSASVPTGVRPEFIDAFRLLAAQAAGQSRPDVFVRVQHRQKSQGPTRRESTKSKGEARPRPLAPVAAPKVDATPMSGRASSGVGEVAPASSPTSSGEEASGGRPTPIGRDQEPRPAETEDFVPIKDILRELDGGRYIDRKYVSSALRKMLGKDFRVTTPTHAWASSVDVWPKGRRRFSAAQDAVLASHFGRDANGGTSFVVFVDPRPTEAFAMPTVIRTQYADALGALVAKAAGLPAPVASAPLSSPAESGGRALEGREQGTESSVPRLGIGREDHEERREGRIERLRDRAGSARAEADQRWRMSGEGLPPGGEPIKVGHHSERRHRRALDKAHANARRAVESSKAAKRLDARADAAERNTAISSDDPQALARLQAKLDQLEKERAEIKTKNALARAGKLSEEENPLNPPHMRSLLGERRFPQPGYRLRNLGAEIRRVKARVEQLSKRQGRVAREIERGEVRVVENGSVNRLQIITPGKPPQEQRTWLKRHGFRWSRTEEAWQRQISDGAWNDGMRFLDTFVEKRDDTPYGSVERTAAKPKFTEADVAFWREEFKALDVEFEGEVNDELVEAVERALRARGSGSPGDQAVAYAQWRRGTWTFTEALQSLYAHRRSAKPKRRPKRAPKVVTSSMSADAFVDALKSRTAELPGKTQVKTTRGAGRFSGVTVQHFNVAAGVTDSAVLENNRLHLNVSGWESRDAPPKAGTVKMEVWVSATLKGLRGRTTTPEKMVAVVTEMLRKHSEQETR